MNDPSFPSSRKGGEGPRIAAPTSNSAKKQRNLRSRGEPIETTPVADLEKELDMELLAGNQ